MHDSPAILPFNNPFPDIFCKSLASHSHSQISHFRCPFYRRWHFSHDEAEERAGPESDRARPVPLHAALHTARYPAGIQLGPHVMANPVRRAEDVVPRLRQKLLILIGTGLLQESGVFHGFKSEGEGREEVEVGRAISQC